MKQKLYFAGDKQSPKTRQYEAVGVVRKDIEAIAKAMEDGVVYTKMITVKEQ